MKRIGRSVVAGGVCLAAAASARDASASGFATQHFGGEQGNVLTSNPTALYYNPAGIAFSEGIHLYLDGNIAIRHATWSHVAPAPGPSDAPNSQSGNTGTASLLNVFAGPTMAATAKFGNFAIGAGLFVPFGGRVNWGKNDDSDPKLPLTANGVQRWHMIDAALTFLQISAGAAYKLGPFAIGVTGNVINSQITETQGRSQTGLIDSSIENTASLDVSGWNGSFGVGAMLEPIKDHLWLGASYQAQPGLGPQTLHGSFTFESGPKGFYPQNGTLTHYVHFHESLPDIWRAGIRVRPIDAFEIRLFGDWTRWSKLQSQCINYTNPGDLCQVYPNGMDASGSGSVLTNIPRNWKDTYGGHLGLSYWVNPAVEVFAGAGYETAASPDATIEPGSMDANNIQMALGGRFLIANYVYMGLGYTQIQFLNRTVTDSQLAVANGQAVSLPTFQQDGNGTYTQWVGVVDVNLEKQF
ncbi:MAG TPA: outer membrane protein transport protein [Polyangiaceae bacterium]|jgi:long-chain fatty acid transport protein|nr:outer membrane protein transport protein [Polyangiaceae bacterium]